jgi:hypothetical protein
VRIEGRWQPEMYRPEMNQKSNEPPLCCLCLLLVPTRAGLQALSLRILRKPMAIHALYDFACRELDAIGAQPRFSSTPRFSSNPMQRFAT